MSSDAGDADPILSEGEESDVSMNDSYSSNDYYANNNEEYKKAEPFPTIECPKDSFSTNQRIPFNKYGYSKITYKEYSEQIISFTNPLEQSSYENEISVSPETVLENYQITLSNEFNYSLNQYDVFSKRHHRLKLQEELNKIDWGSAEYKIMEAKKTTNAYEDVFESYFHKHSAYKLANLNYLFKKELFTIDRFMEHTPIMIVGDNGGFSDYIQWFSYKNGFISKIFLIPERNNSIQSAKFRREIEKDKNNNIDILTDFYNKCDIDDFKSISSEYLADIAKTILNKTEMCGVNLYLARKVIKYTHGYSQEMQYKNFLLINIILCFQTLNKRGNFVIKLYDSFSLFTVSLIFILYKSFEKITIIKPFSTRPYSASRYVVCEKFIEDKPKILNYLNSFFDKYIELIRNGRDVQFVLPVSEINKSENFTSLLMEINSKITEGRIEALMEMSKYLNNEPIMRYDKMNIKKHCLSLWQIPVLKYDERELACNQINMNRENRGRGEYQKNKLKTIEETAKTYENFGKYSKPTEDLVSLLLGGDTDLKEDEVKHTPKERELTEQEKEEQFARIFPPKKNKGKKRTKEEKTNQFSSKKRHRKIDNMIEDEFDSNKMLVDNVSNSPKLKKQQQKQTLTETEEVWNEVLTNREKIEKEKIKVNDDIREQLRKYMKK